MNNKNKIRLGILGGIFIGGCTQQSPLPPIVQIYPVETGFITSPVDTGIINTGITESENTQTGIVQTLHAKSLSGTSTGTRQQLLLLQKKGSKPNTSGTVQTLHATSLQTESTGSDQITEKDIEYLEKIIDSLVKKDTKIQKK